MNNLHQSDEEVYASWFFEELKAKGFIKEIIYQPKPFILAEPVTFKWDKPKPTKKEPNRVIETESTCMQGAEYTADILVIWNTTALGKLCTLDTPKSNKCNLFIAHVGRPNEDFFVCTYSFIEVKPVFDDNNMTREVILKHKWVYKDYGIYVNMFIRDKIMPKLFTPEKYIYTMVYSKRYTDKKKGKTYERGDSKIKWAVKTLSEYLQQFQ